MPMRSLALLLGDVRGAVAHRYGARDSLGHLMDTAKVIQSQRAATWPSTTAARCATLAPPAT
jgi:hypothetical protein